MSLLGKYTKLKESLSPVEDKETKSDLMVAKGYVEEAQEEAEHAYDILKDALRNSGLKKSTRAMGDVKSQMRDLSVTISELKITAKKIGELAG